MMFAIIMSAFLGVMMGCLAMQMFHGIRGDLQWRNWAIIANVISLFINGSAIVNDTIHHQWGVLPFNIIGVGLAILVLYVLLKDKGIKKKVKKWLGAKSKALKEALLKRVKELTPKPVLRPIPVPV